jgi:hypothetical protein
VLGRGVRGLKASFEVVLAGFALLYPPYGSPSPRGWGKEVQGEVSCRESEGVPQGSLQYPPRSKIRLRRIGGQGVENAQLERPSIVVTGTATRRASIDERSY